MLFYSGLRLGFLWVVIRLFSKVCFLVGVKVLVLQWFNILCCSVSSRLLVFFMFVRGMFMWLWQVWLVCCVFFGMQLFFMFWGILVVCGLYSLVVFLWNLQVSLSVLGQLWIKVCVIFCVLVFVMGMDQFFLVLCVVVWVIDLLGCSLYSLWVLVVEMMCGRFVFGLLLLRNVGFSDLLLVRLVRLLVLVRVLFLFKVFFVNVLVWLVLLGLNLVWQLGVCVLVSFLCKVFVLVVVLLMVGIILVVWLLVCWVMLLFFWFVVIGFVFDVGIGLCVCWVVVVILLEYVFFFCVGLFR